MGKAALNVFVFITILYICNGITESNSSECELKQFGHSLLNHFTLDKNLVHINFGSFGSAPIMVQQNQSNYRKIAQDSPDSWFRFVELPHLNNVQRSIAKYIGIKNWMDLVFIPNASNGCNTILRSVALHLQKQYRSNVNNKKYKLLYFNIAYPMVKNTLKFIIQFFDNSIELLQFTVTTEMFNDDNILLTALETFVINDNQIYAAIFSHISSVPSVLFDAKSITNVLHKYNILSIVDGAHGIGQIKLDLDDMNCDFYVSNAHKWLMTPHGSAIMYVKKQYQALIYPLVMNNGAPAYNNKYIDSVDTSKYSQFQRYFVYQGTSDQTAYLAIGAALQFRSIITNNNDDLIINYCHNLAINAGNLIADRWNTSRLVLNDENIGNMVNIEMATQNETEVYMIRNLLFHQSTDEKYAFLVVDKWDGVFYNRVSAQIYNELTDYEWLATTVLQILSNI